VPLADNHSPAREAGSRLRRTPGEFVCPSASRVYYSHRKEGRSMKLRVRRV